MTALEVRAQLPLLAEETYRDFNSGLIPGVTNMLGVRMPALRKLARAAAKADWRGYLAEARDETYEEILLQGMVIGYAKADFQTVRPYVEAFVPKITNWSVCDVFCGGLKVTKDEPEAVWDFLAPYWESEAAYDLRFAAVMTLSYYLDDAHLDMALARLDAIRHEDYYVRMAVAWAVSMAYVADPARVDAYLDGCALDDWTYNKALQKIIESRQVDEDVRARMRARKRKGKANEA